MTARIRIAGYQNETSVHTRAVRAMMRVLQERAAGRVTVDFEPNIADRGRKVADLLDLVTSGDIDLCYFSSSYLASRVPALGIFDIPFQFTDRRDTRLRLEGRLGAILGREIAAQHRM
jgi:TRAP-type C4-dicarboxylate transport system substrate-binding protein